MPVYEYRCDSCNIQFELRQKFSDPPADQCPKCGGTVRKLVSAVSFSLKGSGWFGDGYGSTKSESAPAEVEVAGVTPTGTPAPTEGQSTELSNQAETSVDNQVPTRTQTEPKSTTATEPPTRDTSEPTTKTD